MSPNVAQGTETRRKKIYYRITDEADALLRAEAIRRPEQFSPGRVISDIVLEHFRQKPSKMVS